MAKNKKNTTLTILLILAGLFVLSLALAGLSALFSGTRMGSGNVAVIPVKGPIYSRSAQGIFSAASASAEDIVKFIEQAEKSPGIKAVVFEIDSPGGSAVASDEIGAAIKQMQKPSVAWIRELGASGGYWVASSADHVIANRMSITGSIGVIGSFLEYPDLLKRFNITYNRFVGGEYKDLGMPYKHLEEQERELYQTKIDLIYDYFVQEVAENRNLTLEETRSLATGIIYLGIEAKELGLVDELGGISEVEEHLKKKLGLDKISFVKYERKKSFFDLLASVWGWHGFGIGQGIAHSLKEEPVIKV